MKDAQPNTPEDGARGPTVLVIDDERGPRESLRILLKPDYVVHTAESVPEGIEVLDREGVDVVVLDVRMPGMGGIEGLSEIRQRDADVAVVMLTGYASVKTAQEAIRRQADDYLVKPFDVDQMQEVIRREVARTRSRRTRRAAADEMQQLNERLQRELQEKAPLAQLGQASREYLHDLSNPLTVIAGYVQLLDDELRELPDETAAAGGANRTYVEIIRQHVRQCNDLVSMWKSLSDMGQRRFEPISIAAALAEVVDGARVQSVERQSSVSLDTDGTPAHVNGNRPQLLRALGNIVLNGVQALPPGGGSVEVNCRAAGEWVEVQVRDDGCGIPANEQEEIFKVNYTTKGIGEGSGLGLYITKKVIEAHRGRISLSSAVGVGTVVTVRLPAAAGGDGCG